MSKETTKWRSDRLGTDILVVRWGEVGKPLLIYPTAGGDAEECERFLMIKALAPMLEKQRIKVYSVDAIGTRAILDSELSRPEAAARQERFDAAVYHEVVPAIRADCKSPDIEIAVTGSSLGAFNAVAALCRHPDVFSKALCLSGTYDLSRWMEGGTHDFQRSSPLHFVPQIGASAHLAKLRSRFVLLAHGTGRWESPRESWRMADVLGRQGIPNRVDEWGGEFDHDWPTWRRMLPQYVEELL